jgi:hypothetical protein
LCNKDSLIAYWSFDDSTARDFSGNGYDGRIVNNPQPIIGVRGTAFYFKGKGEYFRADSPENMLGDHIRLPFIDFKQLSDFTITMWVREDSLTHYAGEGYIWFSDSHDDGWLGIANFCQQYPYLDPDLMYLRFAVGAGLRTNLPLLYEFKKEFQNRWKFYCLVYKDKKINAYIDGALIGTLEQDVNIIGTLSGIACHWWYYSGEHRISTRFTGAIDEVKIWCKALTDEEVRKEMNVCNQENLIAYWSFDDSTARDFSGNGYDGIMMRNPKPVAGVFNKGLAMRFEGFGENSFLGSHILLPMINFANYPEFSVSLWVNEEGFSSWYGDAYIFFGDWTYGWLGITNHFNHKYYDGTLETNFTAGSVMHDHQITVPFNKDKDRNRWKHYCMTYANGTLKAYIDGEFVGEDSHKVKIYGDKAGLNRSWWENGTITSTRFIGSMDEVKIFCKALSPCEIKNIYSPGYSQKELVVLGQKTICAGQSAKVYLSEKYKEVIWSNGQIADTATISKPGNYSVRAFDDYGCEFFKDFQITTDTIVVNINGDRTICEGDSTVLSVIGNYKNIKWSTGDTTNSIVIKKEGKYSVSLVDDFGCIGIGSVEIYVLPAPKPTFTIDSLSIGCKADSAILRSEDGFKGITWYYDNLNNPIEYNKSEIVVKQSGKYIIKVRLNTGCEGTYEQYVDLVPIKDKLELISQLNIGKYSFDTVNILDLLCREIKFKNTSRSAAIINNAYLLYNIDFSLPQSQFPIIIEPDSVGSIILCISPRRLKQIYDTLFVQDTCNSHIIPLYVYSKENEWEGSSKCDVKVGLSTTKFVGYKDILVLPPFPNPSSEFVTIKIYSESKIENFKLVLCDIFGNEISGIVDGQSLSAGINTIIYKTEKLLSGVYYLRFTAKDFYKIIQLNIIK